MSEGLWWILTLAFTPINKTYIAILQMTPDNFTHYTLGIDEIDSEHWRLVCTMNSIQEAITAKDFTKVREYITVLQVDLDDHLANEEAYMERIQYPYLDAHIEQHIELKIAMLRIMRQIDDHHFAIDLSKKLFAIIAGHIDHYDMQIGQYMREQRVARMLYNPTT